MSAPKEESYMNKEESYMNEEEEENEKLNEAVNRMKQILRY
jgi:hypothetical protein